MSRGFPCRERATVSYHAVKVPMQVVTATKCWCHQAAAMAEYTIASQNAHRLDQTPLPPRCFRNQTAKSDNMLKYCHTAIEPD